MQKNVYLLSGILPILPTMAHKVFIVSAVAVKSGVADQLKTYNRMKITRSKRYFAPTLRRVAVSVESGFAQSDEWGADGKDNPSFDEGGNYDL